MIRFQKLKKTYGSKIILQEESCQFPSQERIALVGANGAGKSTLLNMICRLEDPDGGQIILPGGASYGYLPQEPNSTPKATILDEALSGAQALVTLQAQIEAVLEKMGTDYSEDVHKKYERLEDEFVRLGGPALASKTKGILLGLGFAAQQFETNPLNLSGGWRMRLELAKVFVNDPQLLILDEPTNHLDLPSLIWVENYLKGFEGTVLFVSHDRSLLNKLATVTVHLTGGRLTFYRGNFDSFLDQREKQIELDAKAQERRKLRMDQLERFIERFKAKASKARQAQSRMKMLARMRDLEDDGDGGGEESTILFSFPKPPGSGKDVLQIDKMGTGYERFLSKNISQRFYRHQKIAIIGSNGIGKSTFLKTLAGLLPPLEGSYTYGHNVLPAYFAQDQLDMFDPKRSILDNLMAVSGRVSEKQARHVLGGFLFRGKDVYKPFGVLSGGEKSRVGLAALMVQEANMLLLDEITNHLDMSSCDVLAQALEDYEGTILFVSHDRMFIDAVCTHIFAMTAHGESGLFPGKLDDFRRLAAVSGFPDVLGPA